MTILQKLFINSLCFVDENFDVFQKNIYKQFFYGKLFKCIVVFIGQSNQHQWTPDFPETFGNLPVIGFWNCRFGDPEKLMM